MPDTDAILDAFFLEALRGLLDLARTTDKDHIKLRALLEIARLCNPSKPRPRKPTLSPRRVGSPPSPAAFRSGRGRERATGLAPSSPPPIPTSSDSLLRPSEASSHSHLPSGGEALPARRPRPLRGEEENRATEICFENSVPSDVEYPPAPRTPCPTCQTSTPRPACPSCLPHMDAIERSERIRMATQAREAIAINESKGLSVPKQWRAWATVDEGLHPPDTS